MDRIDEQRLDAIRERDVDLIFLEELAVEPRFREFFYGHIGREPASITDFGGPFLSVHDAGLGESDIEWRVTEADGTRVLVMIENKVDADFQDRQLARYRERGHRALGDGIDEFVVCLTAPASYIETAGPLEVVDAEVPFEDVRDWFAERDCPRAAFRAEVLTVAIERSRRGYRRVPDEAMTALHRYYWRIARDRFPELDVAEPDGVPATSSFIYLGPGALPDRVSLVHKIEKGYVDLQFSGARKAQAKFEEYFEPLLDGVSRIDTATESMVVRRDVPRLSKSEPPMEQEEQIIEGLRAARELLEWLRGLDEPVESGGLGRNFLDEDA